MTEAVTEAAHTHAPHSPLAQFEVNKIFSLPEVFGYDISFTNASLFMCLAVLSVAVFILLGMRKRALVPGRPAGRGGDDL